MKKQGAKDDYLTRISWDPSEKFIYIAELNRGQNHMKLNKFDANTGEFTLNINKYYQSGFKITDKLKEMFSGRVIIIVTTSSAAFTAIHTQ